MNAQLPKATAGNSKDTIYIDAEDEITAIIDKVRESPSKIVALVLPKRTPALQSIVNLKLLKRTSDQVKKNLVLITSDQALLPIAGTVGLFVAKTPQSKPEIPAAPKTPAEAKALTIEDSGADKALDTSATVGELAGHVATEETIELDNDKAAAAVTDKAKPAKSKKLKVPDFDRFRLLLFGGIALVLLLIVGSVFAFVVLPKATVTIKTDTSNISSDLNLTASTTAKSVNPDLGILPALNEQTKKTDSLKVPATGQRNDGTKAKGALTLYNCTDNTVAVPAGTQFTNGGLAFATNQDVNVPPSDFFSNGNCKKNLFANVQVTAVQPGDNYNLSSGRTYTTTLATTLTGTGSAMTGGTTKLTQAVSQQDVDNAKQKLMDQFNSTATTDLKNQFNTANALPLTDTFNAGTPTVTSTPNVNDAASEVTVNVSITYTEVGVKQDDLKQIVEADIKKHISSSEQVIQDNGLARATIRVTDKSNATQIKFEVQTVAIAGPQLDTDGIKKQIAGKKKGDAINVIKSRPGIEDVTINYSPFWVYSTPKNSKHITVVFQQGNARK